MDTFPLKNLHTGQTKQILAIDPAGTMSRRLLDIGLTPGSFITRLYAAPSGDPVAYQIRVAVIALRKKDAAAIELIP